MTSRHLNTMPTYPNVTVNKSARPPHGSAISPRAGPTGDTFWDRAQRHWPFTRIMPIIKQMPDHRINLAEHPDSNIDAYGIQVRLENVKQGTYLSLPASLLVFEINWTISSYFPLTCFSMRISSLGRNHTESSTPVRWKVAAYAPAHIVEDPAISVRWPSNGRATPSWLSFRTTVDGLQLIVRARPYSRTGVPRKINVGFVLVHEAPVQLRILPSVKGHRRLSVFRRTKVHPLNIDNSSDLIPLATCANDTGECHPSCRDFGPDHMTADRWKTILQQWELDAFSGEPDESVGSFRFPSTGLSFRPGFNMSPSSRLALIHRHCQLNARLRA